VKFAFIAAEKASYPVRVLCRTLEGSRAGFYAWHTRPAATRTQAHHRLGVEIDAIHAETRQPGPARAEGEVTMHVLLVKGVHRQRLQPFAAVSALDGRHDRERAVAPRRAW
jgi:hypothetical protein